MKFKDIKVPSLLHDSSNNKVLYIFDKSQNELSFFYLRHPEQTVAGDKRTWDAEWSYHITDVLNSISLKRLAFKRIF
jgi:hypothetical protein